VASELETSLLNRNKVVCTTDDPTDSLEYHMRMKEIKDFQTAVLPSFRPDKGLEINRSTYVPWVRKLSQVTGEPVGSYEELLAALEKRAQFFHSAGGECPNMLWILSLMHKQQRKKWR
jgi:glucuronate isomerase